MAIALADEEDIPLVLATDPDADRFCAAERVNGKWHIFSGNEMGIILAHHIFTRYKSQPSFNPSIYRIDPLIVVLKLRSTRHVVLCSIVEDVTIDGPA
jgi:phosphomannomutase